MSASHGRPRTCRATAPTPMNRWVDKPRRSVRASDHAQYYVATAPTVGRSIVRAREGEKDRVGGWRCTPPTRTDFALSRSTRFDRPTVGAVPISFGELIASDAVA